LVKRVAREKENTEKRLKVEKGQKGRAREEEKAWSSEIAGLTQVRGVYHRLTGIMG
jgi:hypothetical protein